MTLELMEGSARKRTLLPVICAGLPPLVLGAGVGAGVATGCITEGAGVLWGLGVACCWEPELPEEEPKLLWLTMST